jgi:hypothetical protein
MAGHAHGRTSQEEAVQDHMEPHDHRLQPGPDTDDEHREDGDFDDKDDRAGERDVRPGQGDRPPASRDFKSRRVPRAVPRYWSVAELRGLQPVQSA